MKTIIATVLVLIAFNSINAQRMKANIHLVTTYNDTEEPESNNVSGKEVYINYIPLSENITAVRMQYTDYNFLNQTYTNDFLLMDYSTDDQGYTIDILADNYGNTLILKYDEENILILSRIYQKDGEMMIGNIKQGKLIDIYTVNQ